MVDVADIPEDQLAELRLGLGALVRDGAKLTVKALQKRARAKTEYAAVVLRAYRGGVFALGATPAAPAPAPVPAPAAAPPPASVTERLEEQAHGGALLRRKEEEAPPRPDLVDLVGKVRTHEKVIEATQVLMEESLRGNLHPKLGKFLLDSLNKARLAINDAAKDVGSKVEDLRPCTAEGLDLLADFEGITCDDRRELVRAFVSALLETDMAAGPSAAGQALPGEGKVPDEDGGEA